MAAHRRLSASPLWAAQRRFYERAGIDAWRPGIVPHHVTSNVALATAYAQIITAFARDTGRRAGSGAHSIARREPLDVVELGAGSGRFAYLLLRALDALGRRAPAIRYLMTDVAKSTIDFWRGHDAFAPYVRTGRLAFARLDADTPAGVADLPRLPRPGGTLSRLVVIANYVFSGLPHDAFVFRAGSIHEYRVAVQHGPHAATGLRAARREDAVSLRWRAGPRVAEPYADADLDAILREMSKAPAGLVLFPVGALRTFDRLRGLADEVLVLVADRGTEETPITSASDLGVARHGSLSFPVNFPALRAWVKRHGGRSLTPPRAEALLQVEAFLMGRRPNWSATRGAYLEAMRAGGPAALYKERRALAADQSRRTPAALLKLMHRCGPDPRVVAECVRPLWPHLADASPRMRRDVARAALAAWPNHYHLGETHDVAFDLGLLLYTVRSYAGARELFETSLRLHGANAATWWNLGLCHLALGRAQPARAAFRRAQRLAPDRHVAGLATLKVDPASQRGR